MLRNITTNELKGMFDSHEKFVLVNVLLKDEFDNERICGSINIPVDRMEKEAKNHIGKDEVVIVHCSGPACTASADAGETLLRLGYRNVRRFEGGLEQWRKAGYCLEGRAVKAGARKAA